MSYSLKLIINMIKKYSSITLNLAVAWFSDFSFKKCYNIFLPFSVLVVFTTAPGDPGSKPAEARPFPLCAFDVRGQLIPREDNRVASVSYNVEPYPKL